MRQSKQQIPIYVTKEQLDRLRACARFLGVPIATVLRLGRNIVVEDIEKKIEERAQKKATARHEGPVLERKRKIAIPATVPPPSASAPVPDAVPIAGDLVASRAVAELPAGK